MTLRPNSFVLSADAAIDLQLHTVNSDGTWTPEALIDHLVSENFALAAITDHDRVDTVAAVRQMAADKGFHLLAAVEMTASWRGEMTDVLCYGFDPDHNELDALGLSVARRQQENTREVCDNLRRQGYLNLPADSPELAAVLATPSAQQPHELVAFFKKHGRLAEDQSAGKTLLEAGLSFITTEIGAIVEAAHQSGAVALIAHPGREDFICYDENLLDELRAEVPIDGFEVYYPAHTPEQTALYLAYAQKHDLLTSSGSDSHGADKPPIKYEAGLSRKLLERLGVQVS